MQRQKGNKLYEALDDYTIIDLETTMRYINPENKIIEISALRVRDNEAADTFSTLVNPGCHIPDAATQVNNITDDMVADAPELSDIFGDFIEFVGNDVLVGHNIDTFDLNILYDVSMELYNKPIKNDYIDTYHLARKCLPELQNYRLETLARHLGLNTSNMHRSGIDCELTKKLYDNLKPLCGTEISPYFYGAKPKTKSQYTYAKVDQQYVDDNPFLGKTCIVYGAFQQLTPDQIQNIFKLIGAYYVDYFCHSADVLILGEDMYNKYISGAEDELIGDYLKLQKPVMSEYDFVSKCHIIFSEKNDAKGFTTTVDIKGKTVCLTGEFDIDSREGVVNRLTELGAIVKKRVIKSLDYLIVGNQGSAFYKNGSTGGKIEKATEFNEKGANITIISENEFLSNELEMV